MASRNRKIIRIGGLALGACLGFSQMIFAEPENAKISIVERELQKRRAAVEEGQTLLLKGDEAYQAGNFKDAVDAYAGANASFQQNPTTLELKESALQRYAQASVELSKQLTNKGQVKEAREVLKTVLSENLAPNDPQVLLALEKLDDPIQTNPALTGEHAENVDQVRRLLYLAQGAYDLAKFDESIRHYTEILRIDPYNQAARRGMERVNSEKTKYYGQSYDHSRAEILMEVDRGWELEVKPNTAVPEFAPDLNTLPQNQMITLKNKISRIIIPQFILDEGNLTEAIELLRIRAAENDNLELVPAMKGINITTNLGNPDDVAAKRILDYRFSIRVSNVSVETLLKYITEATGTGFRYDDFAVTIGSKGASGNTMISRTYRVPPDFLSNLTVGGQPGNTEQQDVFNSAPGLGEKLAKRMGAQEALMQQGVSFPSGASASLNPSTNTLLVINTMSNHDVIEQIINAVVESEPVIVTIKTKMVKVEKNVLEELGFDWMLNEFNLNGDNTFLSGGTQVNGAQINDFPSFNGNNAAENPITAGNRTGDFSFPADKLDSLIAAGISRSAQQNRRAPGVVGVSGVVNSTTIQMLMRGMERNKGFDIMATPAISTRNGQAASVSMVREFIYPVAYDPAEIPQSVSAAGGGVFLPSFPSEYETKDLGVFLEVLPTVDEKRQYVDVALKPMISDLEGFVNYGSPINYIENGQSIELNENPILMPVFNVKEVNTNVVIQDGSTIVIGGLLKDSVTTINDKTPILGDMPLVGRLFQSNAIKRNSIAILFFVTVELVDPTGKPYRTR